MIAALWLTQVLSAAPAPAAATPVDEAPLRFAVVVGSDGPASTAPVDGRDPPPPLAYADDDAARAYLAELPGSERAWLVTTFDAGSARLYPELTAIAEAPTKAGLAHALGEAFWNIRAAKDAGHRTELVFYFAGHGDVSPGGEGYVALADGPFTRRELLTQVVRASPADVNHIIIDACASYFMVQSRGGHDDATTAAVPLTPDLLDLVKPDQGEDAAWTRTGTIVATSDSAAAHESSALGGGVFSYLLRSALSGAADANGDGSVEYGEAAAFIASASAAIDDPRARVHVFAKAPMQRPHASLANLARGDRRFLEIDDDTAAATRVTILDEHGVPYAEVHRAAHARVLVALAGSAFYTVQVGDREATLVPRSAGAYALSSLRFTASAQKRARDGGGGDAFGALFAHPFEPTFVDGFLASAGLPEPIAGKPFDVAYADLGAPPFRFPYGASAAGSFIAAGGFAVASAGCAAMNLARYADLQRSFARSATLDPRIADDVEGWRTASTVTGAAALVAAAAGAGLWWASQDGSDASAPPGGSR